MLKNVQRTMAHDGSVLIRSPDLLPQVLLRIPQDVCRHVCTVVEDGTRISLGLERLLDVKCYMLRVPA